MSDHVAIQQPNSNLVRVIKITRSASEGPMTADEELIVAMHDTIESQRAEIELFSNSNKYLVQLDDEREKTLSDLRNEFAKCCMKVETQTTLINKMRSRLEMAYKSMYLVKHSFGHQFPLTEIAEILKEAK